MTHPLVDSDIFIIAEPGEAAETMAMILDGEGYRIQLCHTVASALEGAKSRRPSVLLIDAPLDAASLQHLRIAMDCRIVSLVPPERAVEAGRSLDLDLVLPKPVDIEALLRALQNAIRSCDYNLAGK